MMIQKINFIITIVLMLFISLAATSIYADEENYYVSHEKGWHWYDDPAEHDEDEKIIDDPVTQMNAENKIILGALYTARKIPTKENVKNYINLQKKVVNESRIFSHVWEAVLLDHPELDYSLKHPINNSAKMVEEDQQRKKEDEAIRILAKQSGLFFFYRSTCPYCRAFAPTVKQFAEMYGIRVIPITTDGIALPEFPDSRINQGQAEKFNVTVEPALFAVNPYTQKAFPITYGLISLSDLKKRILDIATRFEGDVK